MFLNVLQALRGCICAYVCLSLSVGSRTDGTLSKDDMFCFPWCAERERESAGAMFRGRKCVDELRPGTFVSALLIKALIECNYLHHHTQWMEMSSGSTGTKAADGRLAAESLQSVDACAVTTHWQLKEEQLADLIAKLCPWICLSIYRQHFRYCLACRLTCLFWISAS